MPNPPPLQIFVGCLPSSIQCSEIRSYFESFKGYCKCTFFHKKRRRRGYMILEVFSPTVFNKLINSQHVIRGRRLTVRESLAGKRQAEFEKAHNLKRVVLKDVFKWVKDDEIKDALEFRFGKVDLIYSFSDQEINNSKVCHANFCEEMNAKYAKLVGKLHFNGLGTFRVLPFIRKDKPERSSHLILRYNQESIAPINPSQYQAIGSHLGSPLFNFTSQHSSHLGRHFSSVRKSSLEVKCVRMASQALKRQALVTENHSRKNIKFNKYQSVYTHAIIPNYWSKLFE